MFKMIKITARIAVTMSAVAICIMLGVDGITDNTGE
jgi:hypothetical protein